MGVGSMCCASQEERGLLGRCELVGGEGGGVPGNLGYGNSCRLLASLPFQVRHLTRSPCRNSLG